MKTVFLSVRILILGYFCDILRRFCQKAAENNIKKGKGLIKKPLVAFAVFTERSFIKWQKREKQLIYLFAGEQTF